MNIKTGPAIHWSILLYARSRIKLLSVTLSKAFKIGCRPFDLTCHRFLKESMGAVSMASTEVNALQQEVNDLRQRCAALEEENRDLKTQVSIYLLLNRCRRMPFLSLLEMWDYSAT